MCLWFKKIKTVDDLVAKCKDYQSVARWIRWHIFETKPLHGSWPTSKEVLKKRKTWCKGFAVLTCAALKKLGHDPKLVSFMWRDKDHELIAHVVCTYKDGETYHYIDNGVPHHCSVAQQSLKDVAVFACPGKVYSAYERDGEGNLVNILISGV